MRTTLALIVFLSLAHAGPAVAQEADVGLNERTKTPAADPAPASPPAAPAVDPDLVALARRAAALADAGGDELPEARRLLGNLRADARFEALPDAFRSTTLSVAGYVEMRDDEPAAARALFLQAAALPDVAADVWYWLSAVELDLALYDDAARSLARLAQGWPDLLDNIDDDHLLRVASQTDASEAARTELLQALFDSDWQREPLGGASHYHYELALIRARQGDVEALRRIVPRVDGAGDIVRMLIDKRFDAAVDRDAAAFDPRAAAERRVKALQVQLRRAPDRLDIVAELQRALMAVGRFQDVITLAEDVQAAIAAAPEGKPPYASLDRLAWVQNLHASALGALGRFEDSATRLAAASRLQEAGGTNVSQALNLAHLYVTLGRADDALAAAAAVGTNISDYGLMAKAAIEHGAHLLKGNAASAEKAMAYLREHRADAEDIYLAALVEAGDIDEAAVTLVARLSSQDERAEALYELQDFRELPPKPGSERYEANWEKLEDHPQVRAAVEDVGRFIDIDLYWAD